MILGQIEFPPVSHLVEWPDLFGSGMFAVNRVIIQMILSMVMVIVFFLVAGSKKKLVPTGIQNAAESLVDFVQNGIIVQTMGEGSLGWTPFMLTLFSFIWVGNMFEVIPLFQMPVNARIALPVELALLIWVLFNYVGIKNQGLIGYFKGIMFPPGVPVFLYILVTPIELVSTILVRPLSLSVRLFANMLAGHLLLVSFAVLTGAMFAANAVYMKPFGVLPFALLIALTGFEVLVGFLQAFIFTMLAGVYIGSAMHAEH